MNTPRATVSKVLTFSCVDGPGNRLVLFLQGCNFACQTCHNPHTMALCNNCGDCVPACHAGALSLQAGQIAFDPDRCDQCDDCLRACPINANPMVRSVEVADVLGILRENLPFLDGITLSGGEATTQLKFVTDLFRRIKADPDLSGLTCMIDSNGHLGPGGWAKVLPWIDGVMLDIKAFDPVTHRLLTGAGNAHAIESARFLHTQNQLYELRFLIVPGITDTEAELRALCDFVRSIDPDLRVRLNAFQHHGVIGAASEWPVATRVSVEAIAERLASTGMRNVAVPSVYL